MLKTTINGETDKDMKTTPKAGYGLCQARERERAYSFTGVVEGSENEEGAGKSSPFQGLPPFSQQPMEGGSRNDLPFWQGS